MSDGTIGNKLHYLTIFEQLVNKGQANGYAPLDANAKVPTVNLGGEGADNTKYLRGDQTWQVPSGGGGESEIIVVKSADTANSTTTLADATGLTFNADASSTYIIHNCRTLYNRCGQWDAG